MRRCDEPDVNLVRMVATESLELLFLQDAQQFRLKLQRDVADFVKKERAPVRELKAARLLWRPGGFASCLAEALR